MQVTGKQIVILDRGFVYVGDVKIDGDMAVINAALNVRRWDNEGGLGKLAARGPLKTTILVPAGVVRAPLRAVIAFIECEESSWTK